MARKLYGQTTLSALFTVLAAVMVYRYFTFGKDHALQWREPLDLKIYALAGQDVAQGGLLYDAPYIKDLPFTYPPFAGVLFQVFSNLSTNMLIAVWQGATALALLAVVLLVLRNRNIRLGAATVYICVALTFCSLTLAPIAGTVFFGQINVFLMLLVSLDLLPHKLRLPGIGTGLAAGLKLTPAYMGLVLLVQRRWGAAAGAVLTFAFTVAVGWWLIPDAATFWTESIFQSSRVGVHANGGAMAVKSLLERVWGIEGGPVWIATAALIFLVNCGAALVACARKDAVAAMVFTGFGSCLLSPFSWFHHFVWVVPFAVWVLLGTNQFLGRRLQAHLPRGTAAQLAGLLSFAAMCATVLPWVSAPFWHSLSFYNLHRIPDLQPWGTLLFSGAALVYMCLYGLSGLVISAPGANRRV